MSSHGIKPHNYEQIDTKQRAGVSKHHPNHNTGDLKMSYSAIEVRSTEDVIDTVLLAWNPDSQDMPFTTGNKRSLTLLRQFECELKFDSRLTLGVIKELVNLLKSKRQNGTVVLSPGPEFSCFYPLQVRHDGTVQVLQTEAEILMSGSDEEESYVWEGVDTFWEMIDQCSSGHSAPQTDDAGASNDRSGRLPPLTKR